MDKIEISSKDIEEMLKWRDEHKEEVRSMVSPVKDINIICKDSGYRIIAVREGMKLTLSLSRRKGNSPYYDERLGKLVFHIGFGGYSRMEKDTTKLAPEDKQSVFTVYCTLMALMVYGNRESQVEAAPITEAKSVHKAHKGTVKAKKKKSITYTSLGSGRSTGILIRFTRKSQLQLQCKRTLQALQERQGRLDCGIHQRLREEKAEELPYRKY